MDKKTIKEKIIVFITLISLCCTIFCFGVSAETVGDIEPTTPPKYNDEDTSFFGGIMGKVVDGIKGIFVPSDDFITDYFNDIKNKFDEKIPFVSQCTELMDSLFSSFNSDSVSAPEFNITLYGKTHNIIDFSVVDDYMPMCHAIIILIAYFLFIRRCIKRFPLIINDSPMESDNNVD